MHASNGADQPREIGENKCVLEHIEITGSFCVSPIYELSDLLLDSMFRKAISLLLEEFKEP
jgi:hypothetical protein